MSRFFVYRPVMAWVIALFFVLFGVLALRALPVEQLPDIAPPSVTVNATFVGADAQTVDSAVTAIIERELNGVENFRQMSSSSRANGTAQIQVLFQAGTDLDKARSDIQDRVSRVERRLPEEVRQAGIRVTQAQQGFLMMIALQSKGNVRSPLELGEFATQNVGEELRRINGVGDVMLFGSGFAMRIWLDREKLASFGLSPAEVMAAVREQNAQTGAGSLGAQPAPADAEFTAQIVNRGRLDSAEEFRQIILRSTTDGALVRLGDVARVELANDTYAFSMRLNGQPAAGLAVSMTTGANALGTANLVRARLDELSRGFPPDILWTIPFDTSPFVRESVRSVAMTMVQAMVLVSLVVLLFLQSWRTMFLPTLVVPVSLIATCIGLLAFGMSINMLSLFAMVVAIGILNDDAIVIVENVERIMQEEGLEPKPATVKAMQQLTGAIIATTLVLLAVFIPMGFFPGSAGGIYRQFAVTLSVSLILSTVLSLTLAPAICGSLLRPHDAESPDGGPGSRLFARFNRMMAAFGERHVRIVGAMVARPLPWLVGFVAAVALTLLLYMRMPTGFLPDEDQGTLMVAYSGAPGSTQPRTQQAIARAEAVLMAQPEVANVVTVLGFSLFGQGQNMGMSMVSLKPWPERRAAASHSIALVQRLNMLLSNLPELTVFAINPPAMPSLGAASGFSMRIQDRAGAGSAAVAAAAMGLVQAAAAEPVLMGVRPDATPPTPQLVVDVDRIKARALGLNLAQVNQALATMFGSAYVNDFVYQQNVLRVLVQAEADQRMSAEDIGALKLSNNIGESVRFSAFTRTRWTTGPQQVDRFNGFLSAGVSGQAAPGVSSGTAIRTMERLAAQQLPPGMGFEWTGTAAEEIEGSGQIPLLLGLSVLVAFLLLAALYESWSVPVAVLLVVPLGMLGAVALTTARGMPADMYFNVGLIAIIGLAAKNAILIIQFALDEESRGVDTLQATLAASRQRLRPILMTSLTFLVGMLPLVFASGAGAGGRQAVGTGVVGSMAAATALGIFYTPLFYYLIRKWLRPRHADVAARPAGEAGDAA
ncbi:MAG: multidrug efflux RND transporter permease subunit [Pseudoxanthomonas sp.]|nr:multidrug efflux RND transporter permease subunit [Pseudoxanthomonas sp.]